MNRRPRSVIVEQPEQVFTGWSFDIPRCHFPTLGLHHRTFMRERKPYKAWAHDVPLQTDFREGDIFYRRQEGTAPVFLQVVAVVSESVEVHTGIVGLPGRTGYMVPSATLIDWLKAGVDGTTVVELRRGEGKGGLFSWMLEAEE